VFKKTINVLTIVTDTLEGEKECERVLNVHSYAGLGMSQDCVVFEYACNVILLLHSVFIYVMCCCL